MKTKSHGSTSRSRQAERKQPARSQPDASVLTPKLKSFVADVLLDQLLLVLRGGAWHRLRDLAMRKLVDRVNDLLAAYDRRHPQDGPSVLASNRDRLALLRAAIKLGRRRQLIDERKAKDGEVEYQSTPIKEERFHVDERFKRLLPPLTPDEKARQEANWLTEGCRDPLVVWSRKNVLLDGHHRHEFFSLLGQSYKIVYVDLPSVAAAEEWMWEQNYGRRNLTSEAKSYVRGSHFQRAKFKLGTNRHSPEMQGQNAPSGSTAQRLGKHYGVDAATIKRDGEYAAHLDRVAEVCGDEVRTAILARILKFRRSEVARLAALDNARLQAVIQEARTTGKHPRIPASGKSKTMILSFPSDRPEKLCALLMRKLSKGQVQKLVTALRKEVGDD